MRVVYKELSLLVYLMMLYLVFISPGFSTTITQRIGINGSANINTSFSENTTLTEHIIYIDGVAYLNITYADGSTKLLELEKYIKEHEQEWSKDDVGTCPSVEYIISGAVNYLLGDSDVPEEAKDVGRTLDYYFASDEELNYLAENVKGIREILLRYSNVIQNNYYGVESLYRTLEKINTDLLCESKREIAANYNLTSVKCNFPPRVCISGKLNKLEGGRDFCIHTDNDKEYLACFTRVGFCGHIKDIQILRSEVEGYTPIIITFWNPSTISLYPTLKVEIEKDYKTLKLYEINLGEVDGGETKMFKVFLNNSGLKPGNYTMRITLSSGRKDIFEKINFELFEEGKLEREGNLHINYSKQESGDEIEIEEIYENLANYSYPVKIVTEVYLNKEKVGTIESERVFLKSGEKHTFHIIYTPNGSGEYRFLSKVEHSDIKDEIEFNIDASLPSGRFISLPVKLINYKILFILTALITIILIILIIKHEHRLKKIIEDSKKELRI